MHFKLIVTMLLLLATGNVLGHPEDELCVPGQDGMDPALCAALAEMNSSEGDLNQTEMPILDAEGDLYAVRQGFVPIERMNSTTAALKIESRAQSRKRWPRRRPST